MKEQVENNMNTTLKIGASAITDLWLASTEDMEENMETTTLLEVI